MALSMAAQLVATPVASALSVLERTKTLLALDVFRVVTTVGVIYVAGHYHARLELSVLMMGIGQRIESWGVLVCKPSRHPVCSEINRRLTRFVAPLASLCLGESAAS